MSREEAAAKAAYIHHSNEPGFDAEAAWNDMGGTEDWEREQWESESQAALDAADAHDLAHGVHRIVMDDATVERAARALAVETFGPLSDRWEAMDSESHDFLRNTARAVLAAAVQEERA